MTTSKGLSDRSLSDSRIANVAAVTWDVETDVLIAGAGGTGLAAALAAAEDETLTVTILEKADEPGGNTALSTGMIPAAQTRFQQAAGIDESPDDMAADILEKNDHEADDEMVYRLCRQSRHLIHWLVDECNVELEFVDDFKYPRQSEYRMHAPPGRHGSYLVEDLLDELDSRDNIELLTNVPVQQLVADDGDVRGVVAGDRRTESIKAQKVLLATDGFGANQRMVETQIGDAESDLLYYGADGNTGDGIHWGHSLGGEIACMDAYQAHSTVIVDGGIRSRYSIIMLGGILVNENGVRFGDESKGYSAFAEDILAQPGGVAYKIFDQRIYDAVDSQFDDFEEAAPFYNRGETVTDLAESLNLDPSQLRETVEQYNTVASSDDADRFGRTEGLAPISPPVYGIKVQPALFHTQGGLVVDEHARVCREDGTVVENLYAGGGAAVGISGHGADGYSSGNGLTTAFGLGRLAGIHIRKTLAE